MVVHKQVTKLPKISGNGILHREYKLSSVLENSGNCMYACHSMHVTILQTVIYYI